MAQTYYGESLLQKINRVSGMRNREIFPELEKFVSAPPNGKVCVLFGIRQTGKTTMMLQMMRSFHSDNFLKSVYIHIRAGDSIEKLENILDSFKNKGFVHFFIDEITNCPDFIQKAGSLADNYADCVHLVLAGTDSLSFALIRGRSLYGRAVFVDTTWIPYREHSRLMNITSIDEYIQTGGILGTEAAELAETRELETIAYNIRNSLKRFEDSELYSHIQSLEPAGKVVSLINTIVRHRNHSFLLSAINKEYVLSDLMTGLNSGNEIWKKIKKELKEIMSDIRIEVMKRLSILENHAKTFRLTRGHIAELNTYMRQLGLILPCKTIFRSDYAAKDRNDANSLSGRWLLTQPGMRWAHVDALMKAIEKKLFEVGRYSQELVYQTFNLVKSNVQGNMIEEIVLIECMNSYHKTHFVYPFKTPDGEIDLVLAQKDGKGYCSYEIKFSTKPEKEYSQHLRNPINRAELKRRFGPVQEEAVIYRGETGLFGQTAFKNVNSFLLSLPHERIKIRDNDSLLVWEDEMRAFVKEKKDSGDKISYQDFSEK